MEEAPPMRGLTRRRLISAAVLVGLAACDSSRRGRADTSVRSSSSVPAPSRGGTLRVGIVGGTNDIVDGQRIIAKPDIARLVAGWEPLATYDDAFQVTVDGGLAEEVEAKSASLYVIRVRPGVEFHNGKTLGADDVVYSFNRAIDPQLGINPALAKLLAPSGISKLDDRTVQIQLERGATTFLDTLALYVFGMVPEGYRADDPEQVGTGPFKLASFTPGSESRHVRHENYWQTGKPYLDGVEIIDFSDSTALINALLAGQIDCLCDLPFAQVPTIEADGGLRVLESRGGTWLPLTMAVDQPPFDDVRVRQAFRLIVDRQEMVDRVLAGHGRVANDMYAPLDPCYADDLPQRVQDLDQARALLRAAGHESLQIDLYAPNDVAGLADMAAVFADHAAKAGVQVDVHVLPSGDYWGADYCKRTFATAFWGTRPYLAQVPLSSLHDATFPETHWPPADSTFADRYLQALSTTDGDERCRIVHDMQQEEYDSGGNIIAFFSDLVDAHSAAVHGLVARPNVVNLDQYGRGFKDIWLEGSAAGQP
jgi:peptide/nickel transport system substrate-binding protein